jgi:hypothetical protein
MITSVEKVIEITIIHPQFNLLQITICIVAIGMLFQCGIEIINLILRRFK